MCAQNTRDAQRGTEAARPVRVLLVDDQNVMRSGLKALLEREPNVTVVGEAENGRQAVQAADRLAPDVVLMDILMPDLNGIDATRQILRRVPNVKVIALAGAADPAMVNGMIEAGAFGYVLKDCILAELLAAIESVMANRLFLSSSITGMVVEKYRAASDGVRTEGRQPLTARERDVLRILAEGKSTKQIADYLDLSTKTIDLYRHRIMLKLELHSVAELTKYAIREGLTHI
jgi:DNA-binding NarL/FixJ family response regulator